MYLRVQLYHLSPEAILLGGFVLGAICGYLFVFACACWMEWRARRG